MNEELKFFGKIQKKIFLGGGGGRVGGVRVDVNKELKFLGKFTKKSVGGGGLKRGSGRGVGLVGGGGQGGCECNVGGDVGYGNQE